MYVFIRYNVVVSNFTYLNLVRRSVLRVIISLMYRAWISKMSFRLNCRRFVHVHSRTSHHSDMPCRYTNLFVISLLRLFCYRYLLFALGVVRLTNSRTIQAQNFHRRISRFSSFFHQGIEKLYGSFGYHHRRHVAYGSYNKFSRCFVKDRTPPSMVVVVRNQRVVVSRKVHVSVFRDNYNYRTVHGLAINRPGHHRRWGETGSFSTPRWEVHRHFIRVFLQERAYVRFQMRRDVRSERPFQLGFAGVRTYRSPSI